MFWQLFPIKLNHRSFTYHVLTSLHLQTLKNRVLSRLSSVLLNPRRTNTLRWQQSAKHTRDVLHTTSPSAEAAPGPRQWLSSLDMRNELNYSFWEVIIRVSRCHIHPVSLLGNLGTMKREKGSEKSKVAELDRAKRYQATEATDECRGRSSSAFWSPVWRTLDKRRDRFRFLLTCANWWRS